MKVNRKALLSSLSKVWPAVGRNALVPQYQCFTFYGDRVQATGGARWLDASLPEGICLNVCVQAEPLYNLLQKMTQDEIDILAIDDKLTIKATKPKVLSEFITTEPRPTPLPQITESISLDNLEDFIQGLEFCRFGASQDETMGALCGVYVGGSFLWACDRFRVLQWNLTTPVNLRCTLPVKFVEYLVKCRSQIGAIQFEGTAEGGGQFTVQFKDGTLMWGSTLTGEYPDLAKFFPAPDQSERIQLDETFPDAMERHLTFLKDVPAIDKEVVFEITRDECISYGEKKSAGKRVERCLRETTSFTLPRTDEGTFEFRINPALLKDVMGLCWMFKYFSEATVVLFETPKFLYLVQTRG